MTNNFITRVIKTGIVDTRKYRYSVKEYADRAEIQRIELDKLGTTAALTGWQTVKVIKGGDNA